MVRLAVVLAVGALVAAGMPAPGLYAALGLGIAAIGVGSVAFARREAPGGGRLAAAAAITVGAIGFSLGAVRLVIVLTAISRIGRML